MWATTVSNSDTVLRQLQAGFSEALATHPMLVVGGAAGALAMISFHWLVIIEAELREVRARRADREWPIRSPR